MNKLSYLVSIGILLTVWVQGNLSAKPNHKMKRVSVSSQGSEADSSSYSPSLSATGRFVAFDSEAGNLAGKDDNSVSDVFVHDRRKGVTKRVSLSNSGGEAIGEYHYEYGLLGSYNPSISGNGELVAFESYAANLVENDRNQAFDIFVRNIRKATTERVSLSSSGEESDGDCFSPQISESGRFVAYDSYASNLVGNDTNYVSDIFVFDRKTKTTERVSVSSLGEEANDSSFLSAVSSNGRYIVFISDATNLVANDSNGYRDVFVHDRRTGFTTRVSVSSSGIESDGDSYPPVISGNGRYVAFPSSAANLVADDRNDAVDVFVHDLKTRATIRVSVDSLGNEGNENSFNPSLSRSGKVVAYSSSASNLVTSDKNDASDVFLHNLKRRQTQRISVNPYQADANGDSYEAALSANGRFIGFSSYASNLAKGDHNENRDIFIRRR